ncbi:MAG TPA: GNAT family N-acetyltransferase [Ignavibacteria bacterium]|nr:GNAT family N-acetyltransferase [Ignavibacteria bacterium]HMR39159.1 GNAT family N-acetyltransferase [Ignavibacteria bacterium]
MIELVKISDKHMDSLVKLLNNENVSKWLLHVPFPYSHEDAEKFIEKCRDNNTDHLFAIEKDGMHVGGIGIHIKGEHKAEIGYWLGEEYWRKGYLTVALNKVIDLALNDLNLKRIYAGTFENNIASEKLLLKCGFEYEGTLRKNLKKGGVYFNEKIFSIIAD